MEHVLKAIGERVRKARTAKNISQAQLAEALNISPSHMSNIELGKNAMNVTTLYKLCNLLEVSADWIVRSETKEGKAYTVGELTEMFEGYSPEMTEAFLSIFQFAQSKLQPIIHVPKDDK